MTIRPHVNIDKKQLQRQFGRAAHTYNQHAQMQFDIAECLAADLPNLNLHGELHVNELGVGEQVSIADLGCGTGVGIRLLHKRYPQAALLGIDIAVEMLQVAQLSHPYSRFLKQDIENLSLPSESVDLLFSSSAIQWCDASRVLSECFRVLKPGGHLLFSTFLHGTLSGWREMWMSEQQIKQHAFLTKSAILRIVKQEGFNMRKNHQQCVTQKFTSFEQATTSIKALGAGNAVKSKQGGLMGKQKYFRLKQSLEQQLFEKGGINLDYEIIYCVATKGESLL